MLFDLDGTLTDPFPGLSRSVLSALERMDRPLPAVNDLRFIVGPPIQQSLGRILQTDDPAEIDRCLKLFRERYSAVGLFENEVYPGIPGALEVLRGQGYPLYLATGKPKPFADRILDRFNLAEFFEATYGSNLSGTRIEKHEVIEDALSAHAIRAEDALMIGDREHDILGAHHHGMSAIGVLYGYGSRQELEAAGAVALCISPDQLPETVGTIATA